MKNRIIDYFILFVGGCLIFTVVGGMVVGLLKLIQITADEPFPNQSGVDSNYFSIGGPAQHPYQTDIGGWKRAARREGWSDDEIDAVIAEAKSGDYDHLVQTIMGYSE